ncbi:ATP-grasp domain-containing protein [Fluviispira multicolorata]|uniref:ATP-grasp domain-containing protein n=1 Tax=Fluviispira multicolorata TaxID=2654512 RepID=A0A833N650_9BACT|nr:ATP-grasp domain-containing protein [Fluviispira multicolorata]KAB8032109.1 ATP-grasp domain-containing protein [Fluviispira multicolorata]
MNRGVIILSHRGFSFLEETIKWIKIRNLKCFVLSSSIDSNSILDRHNFLKNNTDNYKIIEHNFLDKTDIKKYIEELVISGYFLLGCISVWESYRSIMAYANKLICVNDLTEENVNKISDKYFLRKKLNDFGLSSIKSYILTRENIEYIKKENRKMFLKPRIGMASFLTKKLDNDTYDELIKHLFIAEKDLDFNGTINSKTDLIVENFIEGKEYSFEVVCSKELIQILAVNEKYFIHQTGFVNLETACVCPPISLTENELQNGIKYITDVCSILSLNNGVFHIEAKYERSINKWEIIEINCRVGGSFINKSSEKWSGINLIDIWLDIILGNEENLHKKIIKSIKYEGISSFFRVYFGEPDKKILSVSRNEVEIEPNECQILIKLPILTPKSQREIFIAQSIWHMKEIDNEKAHKIMLESNKLLEIKYA